MKTTRRLLPGRFQKVIRFLLYSSLSFLFLAPSFFKDPLTLFQARDIRRSLDILNGSWIWYGPDLMGGGHTPGPSYYYLLAIPLSIFGTWESTTWFILILGAMSIGFFLLAAEALWSPFAGMILFYLLLQSHFFQANLSFFWNPSVLPLFQALIFLFLLKPKAKRSSILAASMILGMSLQIHYTQLVFLGGMIFSLALYPPDRKFRWHALGLAILGFFTPLLPYMIWKLMNPTSHVGFNVLEGGVTVYLSPFLSFFHTNFSEVIMKLGENSYKFVLERFRHESALLFLLPIWLISMKRYRRCLPELMENKFLLFSLLFSFIPLLPIFYEIPRERYLIPLYLVVTILSVPLVVSFEKDFRKLFWAGIALTGLISISFANVFNLSLGQFLLDLIFVALVYLIFKVSPQLKPWQNPVLALFFLLFLRFHTTWGHVPNLDSKAKTASGRAILLEKIVRHTGWDYENFRTHTYQIGIYCEFDFELIYNQIFSKIAPSSNPNIDGLIVVNSSHGSFLTPDNPPKWDTVKSELPLEIYRALMDKTISCKLTEEVGDFDLCFYKFNNPDLKVFWNNIGYTYVFSQPELIAQTSKFKSQRIASDRWIFSINNCKNLDPTCAIYFDVNLLASQILEITVLGDPLGPAPAANPAWSVGLRGLSLEMKCGKESRKIDIVSHIGMTRDKFSELRSGFSPPYSKRVLYSCDLPQELNLFVGGGTSFLPNGYKNKFKPVQINWSP